MMGKRALRKVQSVVKSYKEIYDKILKAACYNQNVINVLIKFANSTQLGNDVRIAAHMEKYSSVFH